MKKIMLYNLLAWTGKAKLDGEKKSTGCQSENKKKMGDIKFYINRT